jgi:hypothetical protein
VNKRTVEMRRGERRRKERRKMGRDVDLLSGHV